MSPNRAATSTASSRLPRLFGAFLASLLLAGPLAADPLVLILDASGSMWGRVDGKPKVEIAREVLGDLVDGMDPERELALVAYGHRQKGDCDDIEVLLPLGSLDPEAVKSTVGDLNPLGMTPITASVGQALELVPETGASSLVLLTDGLETCDGDPCEAVRLAREAGSPFVFHVIGFDVGDEDTASLECMAQAGGGLYLPAADAAGLSAALDATAAAPAEIPDGALVVEGVADGELWDLSIRVRRTDGEGPEITARTYTSPETNPRRIPLDDGSYSATVRALGVRGDVERRFDVTIADGSVVEKRFDFSTGEIAVGVTRNGELSDATVTVFVAANGEEVDKTRTYTKASTNPTSMRLTPGTYRVEVGAIEVSGNPTVDAGEIELAAGQAIRIDHEIVSADVAIGARHGQELVDALVRIVDADGKTLDQGRTYTSANSNPKSFTVPPGTYRIEISALRLEGKPERSLELDLEAGAAVEETVDFARP